MTYEVTCTACWLKGVTTPATCTVGVRTLCSRHAHPSAEPLRTHLTVIEGGEK